MAGGAVFRDQTGHPVLPTLDADGAIRVASEEEGGGDESDVVDSTPGLLRLLILEMRELRRVFCKAENQSFREVR